MKKENKKIEFEKKNRQYNIIEIIGMTITLILLIFATIYVNYNNREKKLILKIKMFYYHQQLYI